MTGTEFSLRIAVIDESAARGAVIDEGLKEAGHTNVVRIPHTADLLARLSSFDPEVILIDLGNPSRDLLEQMFQITRAMRRPTAMFVDRSDAAAIQAAMDAGISAYVVDGLKKERVKSILDMCISRFKVFSRLEEELREAKNALEERKVLDRAKGILMQAKNISEQEAYGLLRRAAMNEKRRIIDIAQAIVTAAEVLK